MSTQMPISSFNFFYVLINIGEMISLENAVIYLGSAGVIYCLIKAFSNDLLDDTKIAIIVISIMIIIIFLMNKNKKSIERFSHVVPNSTIEPNSTIVPNSTIGTFTSDDDKIKGKFITNNGQVHKEKPKRQFDYGTDDQDMIDYMNISHVDKVRFEDMLDTERAAKECIKKNYHGEMMYTKSNPFNTLPLGRELNPYTYLPEFAWFRGYEQPPVCIPSSNSCPVCPLATKGTTDLMHFDNVDNIRERAPQNINLKYTKRVLNGKE
jgi:hypothetical protein